MGLCLAKVPTPEEKDARGSVKRALQSTLAGVKAHIGSEMIDTTMITDMMNITLSRLCHSAGEERCEEIFAFSLAGYYLLKQYPGTFSDKFLKGFVGLMTCERLGTCADLSLDFLDLSAALQYFSGMAEEELSQGAIDRVFSGILPPVPFPHRAVEPKATADDKAAHAQAILEMLEPLLLLIDDMPESLLADIDMSERELLFLKMSVGSAALAIKTYSPSSPGGRRAAFVGPEGVGKSTAINYFTSNGTGTDFMYTAPRRGTTMCCFISHGLHETMQQGPSEPVRACRVHEELERVSKSGASGCVSGFDMLRVTKPFNPPGGVSLIDVPGIRQETQLETALTLSLATTLVLCTGTLEDLQEQLRPNVSGGTPHSLSLIPQMAEKIEPPLPIHCIITRSVQRQEFSQKRAGYIDELKRYFQRSEITIQFCNFTDMTPAEKTEAHAEFYSVVNTAPERTSDMYAIVGGIGDGIQQFTRRLSGVLLKRELRSYLDAFKNLMRKKVGPQIDEIIGKSQEHDTDIVEQELSGNPFSQYIDVVLGKMPVTRMVMNEEHLFSLSDRVLVNQELLFEAQVCLMDWLLERCRSIYDSTMGEIVHSVAAHCCPRHASETDRTWKMKWGQDVSNKFIGAIVSSAVAGLGPSAVEVEDEDRKKSDVNYWEASCCNKIGNYLWSDDFPWVLTGFYLISTDKLTQHEFLKGLRSKKEADEESQEFLKWSRSTKQRFTSVPYAKWYDELQLCQSMEGIHNKVFDCIVQAANVFARQVRDATLLLPTSVPLKLLLKLAYAIVQRIFVVLPGSARGKQGLMFTSFGERARSSTEQTVRLRHLHEDILERCRKEEPQQVVDLCFEAMNAMSSYGANSMPWFKDEMQQMKEWLEAMITAVQQLESGYNKAGSGVMLVQRSLMPAERLGTAPATSPPALWSWWCTGAEAAAIDKSEELVCPVALDRGACPVVLDRALEQLRQASKFQVHEPELHGPDTPNVDFKVYASMTLRSVRETGSRVMVLVRRDVSSPSPVDYEVAVLREVSQEPRLSTCIVLWTPPGEIRAFTMAEYGQEWSRLAGNVDIDLQALRTDEDSREFIRRLGVALSDSDDKVARRVAKLAGDLMSNAKRFAERVLGFQAKMECMKVCRPAELQQSLADGTGSIKRVFDAQMKSLAREPQGAEQLEVPKPELLRGWPNFRHRALGAGIDELQCRSFIYRVLLAQIMVKAESVAEMAYDAVIKPVLDKVAEFFCTDPETMAHELDKFCGSRGEGERPQHSEPTLWSFVRRDHFAAVYMGCALSEVLPMLHAVVLPRLLAPGGVPSKKFYAAHIEQASQGAAKAQAPLV